MEEIDLIVLLPSKRTRFTRLCRAVQVGQFQTLGFNDELAERAPASIELKVRFLDRLSKQIIEPAPGLGEVKEIVEGPLH